MDEMTLREVCRTTGVTRRAVQGYEKANLVSPTGKNNYGHLLYDRSAQQRIKEIKQFQDMGFQIKEIQNLMTASPSQFKAALLEREKRLLESLEHTETMIQTIRIMIQQLD